MECPRCRKDGFSPDGTCPACNYRAEQKKTATGPELQKQYNGNLRHGSNVKTTVDAPSLPNQEELPPWRQELTQRLAALKTDKGTERNTGPSINSDGAAAPGEASVDRKTQPVPRPVEHAGSIQVLSPIPKTTTDSANTRSTPPRQKTIASLGPELFSPPKPNDSKDVRELIDSAVSRRTTPKNEETPIFRNEPSPEQENKLILLSRTLSGLIDLIVIVLCTGTFIISADYVSGIEIMDSVSLVEYTVLFLMIFFLYSIFFLAASGQTIGMMITDLRIAGIGGSHPSIGQLFSRCFGYLLSVAVFGAGLLWSLFDRNNMCFHDRFSKTSIRRI